MTAGKRNPFGRIYWGIYIRCGIAQTSKWRLLKLNLYFCQENRS